MNIVYIIIYFVFILIVIPVVYFLINKNRDSDEQVSMFDV